MMRINPISQVSMKDAQLQASPKSLSSEALRSEVLSSIK